MEVVALDVIAVRNSVVINEVWKIHGVDENFSQE